MEQELNKETIEPECDLNSKKSKDYEGAVTIVTNSESETKRVDDILESNYTTEGDGETVARSENTNINENMEPVENTESTKEESATKSADVEIDKNMLTETNIDNESEKESTTAISVDETLEDELMPDEKSEVKPEEDAYDSEKNPEETLVAEMEEEQTETLGSTYGDVTPVDKPDDTEDGSTSDNNDLEENQDKSASSAIENDNGNELNENTEFVQVNSEKDDNEKDMNKADELLEDPIGGNGSGNTDENDSENIESIGEGADEELCIIPDTERVLSQKEKDTACNLVPLKDLLSDNQKNDDTPQNSSQPEETPVTVVKYKEQEPKNCRQCVLARVPKYELKKEDNIFHICNDECLEEFKKSANGKIVLNWASDIRVKDLAPKVMRRSCACCKEDIFDEESNLVWEIMDFCNTTCLTKYQKEIGSKCATCAEDVKSNSLGKYCVRFGNDIRQFCSSLCLESYKKGLKVCSYCQQDISVVEGVVGVSDNGQIKDFCSRICMEKYDTMINNKPPQVDEDTKCCVCMLSKPITLSFERDETVNYFCGEPCFVAFSFVNNIKSDKCAMCRRHFPIELLEKNTMFCDNSQRTFCSNSCKNIYIIAQRKIVPCTWCKVKKYNFDMIQKYAKNGPYLNMCSVNCLNLYHVSLNAVSSKKTKCDFCTKHLQAMYHLTMSDATLRNFCSYVCVMSFQNKFKKTPIMINEDKFPVPTGAPKRNKKNSNSTRPEESSASLPVISNVQSLAPNGTGTRPKNISQDFPLQVKHHIVVKNPPVPNQRNVGTMCRSRMSSKGSNAIPKVENVHIQTDDEGMNKILVPIPVPIFVPLPMHMFAAPVPTPVPIPIPVPVPIFIPTTRNSANGIMKEIKKIQVKIPTNPYEAELLMMAEMVADDKKEENTDSESEIEDAGADDTGGGNGSFSPEPQDGSNTFGDDMLQMALKMATELDEPAVDLEGALTANTITAPQTQDEVHNETAEEVQSEQMHLIDRGQRGRKRNMRGSSRGQSVPKRGRRSLSQHVEMAPIMQQQQQQQPPPPQEPQEKPDANMCLKYTFGVNAWKQWVTFKNAELEKSSRRVKLFKTEILQLTADELNYSLCLFVKEVRKPNGAEYAPDTIYYLCLGIQQYLFENGRIDNIFCDPYYEKFTDCLDEVAKRFSVLYNDSHYIVTRVEEEHLWESKQLGAHSPHVLLSTLMFFNTKHFNLTTVDEHMQLSFSHIMKHWKRNPNQAGASKIPGSRNVLLRFYPPASAIQNTRKKKVYEQQENEENPLRCPVKLYEFYLSKCPESVKTRNDVFYLQPERSCVPDSPVWYSTMPLPREALEKMLHRVKMVKEINVALLTS